MRNSVALIFSQSASTTSTISPWEELSSPVRNHGTADRTPGPIRNTERPCGYQTATEQQIFRTSPSPARADAAKHMFPLRNWRPFPRFGYSETFVHRYRTRPSPASRSLRFAVAVVRGCGGTILVPSPRTTRRAYSHLGKFPAAPLEGLFR